MGKPQSMTNFPKVSSVAQILKDPLLQEKSKGIDASTGKESLRTLLVLKTFEVVLTDMRVKYNMNLGMLNKQRELVQRYIEDAMVCAIEAGDTYDRLLDSFPDKEVTNDDEEDA